VVAVVVAVQVSEAYFSLFISAKTRKLPLSFKYHVPFFSNFILRTICFLDPHLPAKFLPTFYVSFTEFESRDPCQLDSNRNSIFPHDQLEKGISGELRMSLGWDIALNVYRLALSSKMKGQTNQSPVGSEFLISKKERISSGWLGESRQEPENEGKWPNPW
jgi:hypothetical protein